MVAVNGKLVAFLLAAAIAAGGCAVCPRFERHRTVAATNVLFNPEWISVPPETRYGSDWPSTIAYSDPGEEIAYQETIMDWQGGFAGNRDRYYRRFDSTRGGRARR